MRPPSARVPILVLLLVSLPGSFLWAGVARAQTAPPDASLFAFPSSNVSPATGLSAGLGLSDRWLGDEPFDNPALSSRREAGASGALHRVSRQDLRADNRQYDEQPFFIDPVSLWATLPLRQLRLALYGNVPVLRREDNSFLRGEPGGPVPPAIVATTAETREIRGGLAAATVARGVRFGVGVEYTHRTDRYSVTDDGSPESGTRTIDFNGGGVGAQAGLHFDMPRNALGEIAVGASMRLLPALSLEGERSEELTFLDDTTIAIAVERASGWEGGLSLADRVTPTVRLLAGAGIRTARAWDSFGVTSGRSWSGALGLEYHDARDPWTARIAVGREGENGSRTPRATIVGIGMGWRWDRLVMDLGILRRSLAGGTEPTSFDDRMVVSVSQGF